MSSNSGSTTRPGPSLAYCAHVGIALMTVWPKLYRPFTFLPMQPQSGSTTLCREAIHAADHLPDSELGPCSAAAAHRWDHPADRAAAGQADRSEEAPAGRARGSDFWPQKHSFFASVTNTNSLAETTVPELRRCKWR